MIDSCSAHSWTGFLVLLHGLHLVSPAQHSRACIPDILSLIFVQWEEVATHHTSQLMKVVQTLQSYLLLRFVKVTMFFLLLAIFVIGFFFVKN